MARVTEKEIVEFHELLDSSLAKLNTPKNVKKKHWSKLNLFQLKKMIMIETHELDLAIFNNEEIETECDDIINLTLFIKHNLRKQKEALNDTII